MSYRLTKPLELASSEPTAGSVLGTFANEIVRTLGAMGAVVAGAVVVVGTSVVVVAGGPGGGVRAYHAAPATTTIMITTAIAI